MRLILTLKRLHLNETILGTEGLGHECKVIAKTIGLPDLMDKFATTSKGDIGKAIKQHSERTTKEEVEASRKVGDRATENPSDREYLTCMTLPDSRIWMRVRARSIKGVKVNTKRSHANLSCRFCQQPEQTTTEDFIQNKTEKPFQILNQAF